MTGAEEPAQGSAAPSGWSGYITGLGIGQIVSWGTLYYSFPLIAEPMGRELGLSKGALYGAATFGILVAGAAAYPVGAAIDRGRGRAVMAAGSVLGGLLMIAWGIVGSLAAFYVLFAGIGLAQAMTMYDPVFAVVTRRYGAEARRGITAITLWGGFASTVFIPITQALLSTAGWRWAVIGLGLFNLLLCVPLNLLLINPRHDVVTRPVVSAQSLVGNRAVFWASRQPAFWGLLGCFTLFYGVFAGLTLHWYPMLIERGYSVAAVVAALTIIGPAQVAGRILMWVFARQHPVRLIGIAAIGAFPLCLLVLLFGPQHFATLALFAALCGGANGVITIVRGLVVPEMLTREAYGAINGAMLIPSNLAKALAPAGVAALWELSGGYTLVLAAGVLVSFVAALAFIFASATTRSPAAAQAA
jgi:MFS family permease